MKYSTSLPFYGMWGSRKTSGDGPPNKKQEQQQLKSFFGSLAFGRRPKMKIQNYIGLEPVFFTTIFLVNS